MKSSLSSVPSSEFRVPSSQFTDDISCGPVWGWGPTVVRVWMSRNWIGRSLVVQSRVKPESVFRPSVTVGASPAATPATSSSTAHLDLLLPVG